MIGDDNCLSQLVDYKGRQTSPSSSQHEGLLKMAGNAAISVSRCSQLVLCICSAIWMQIVLFSEGAERTL